MRNEHSADLKTTATGVISGSDIISFEKKKKKQNIKKQQQQNNGAFQSCTHICRCNGVIMRTRAHLFRLSFSYLFLFTLFFFFCSLAQYNREHNAHTHTSQCLFGEIGIQID